MYEGKPVEPKNQRHLGSSAGVRAKRGGFFIPPVKPGEIVNKGHIIGKITNIFGETIEEITSPIDGCVLIINFLAAKNTGDPLFSISKVIR